MKQQQLVGLTLVPVSLAGFLCNWTIFLVACRIKSLHPPFALLVATMAIADGIGSTLFAFYVTPMIVFDLNTLKFYSFHCGFLLMIAYDITLNMHVLTILNRFVAVFLPFSYSKVFGLKSTKIWIALTTIISLTILTTFFQILGCHVAYDDEYWILGYSWDPICIWYASNLDTKKQMFTTVFGVFVNVGIIWRVRRTRKRNQSQSSEKFRKREMGFLRQTTAQASYLLFYAYAYYSAGSPPQNHIVIFLQATLYWCSLHTVDGLIVLAFNTEIRGAILSGFRSKIEVSQTISWVFTSRT